MKDKGLLLSKLPRATEMRLLSRRGKRKQMDPQAGALPQSISAGDQPRLIQGLFAHAIRKKLSCENIFFFLEL